jgi:purine-binding chemotaxis protein CheW
MIMNKVLTFKINNENYCFDVMQVVSIDQHSAVAEIPLSNEHVEGVINLRGQIIPVVDLRKLFKFKEKTENRETCHIFIDTEVGRLACVVDSVCDVVELGSEQNSIANIETVHSQTTNYISDILKIKDSICFLLNVNKIYESISVVSVSDSTTEEKAS